jgi:hypothetical protein
LRSCSFFFLASSVFGRSCALFALHICQLFIKIHTQPNAGASDEWGLDSRDIGDFLLNVVQLFPQLIGPAQTVSTTARVNG